MAHARAASGASFTLHYYVSRAQEAAFATEIARQLTGGICQIHCSDEGQSPRQRLAQDLGAPDADTGSTSAVRPDLWPGFAIPRGRSDGRRRKLHSEAFQPPAPTAASAADGTFTITLASHRGALAGAGGQNHRPGAAGAWRRGAALLRDGDLRRLPDAGTRGEPSTTGIPCSRRRKNRPQSSILRCAAPAACRPI